MNNTNDEVCICISSDEDRSENEYLDNVDNSSLESTELYYSEIDKDENGIIGTSLSETGDFVEDTPNESIHQVNVNHRLQSNPVYHQTQNIGPQHYVNYASSLGIGTTMNLTDNPMPQPQVHYVSSLCNGTTMNLTDNPIPQPPIHYSSRLSSGGAINLSDNSMIPYYQSGTIGLPCHSYTPSHQHSIAGDSVANDDGPIVINDDSDNESNTSEYFESNSSGNDYDSNNSDSNQDSNSSVFDYHVNDVSSSLSQISIKLTSDCGRDEQPAMLSQFPDPSDEGSRDSEFSSQFNKVLELSNVDEFKDTLSITDEGSSVIEKSECTNSQITSDPGVYTHSNPIDTLQMQLNDILQVQSSSIDKKTGKSVGVMNKSDNCSMRINEPDILIKDVNGDPCKSSSDQCDNGMFDIMGLGDINLTSSLDSENTRNGGCKENYEKTSMKRRNGDICSKINQKENTQSKIFNSKQHSSILAHKIDNNNDNVVNLDDKTSTLQDDKLKHNSTSNYEDVIILDYDNDNSNETSSNMGDQGTDKDDTYSVEYISSDDSNETNEQDICDDSGGDVKIASRLDTSLVSNVKSSKSNSSSLQDNSSGLGEINGYNTPSTDGSITSNDNSNLKKDYANVLKNPKLMLPKNFCPENQELYDLVFNFPNDKIVDKCYSRGMAFDYPVQHDNTNNICSNEKYYQGRLIVQPGKLKSPESGFKSRGKRSHCGEPREESVCRSWLSAAKSPVRGHSNEQLCSAPDVKENVVVSDKRRCLFAPLPWSLQPIHLPEYQLPEM